MQKTLSSQLVKQGKEPAPTANTSDLKTTVCDMGDCQNATAIINASVSDTGFTVIKFWTSSSDAMAASGTAQVAGTHTILCAIASDDDSLQAWSGNTVKTDLSVASNVIAAISADCSIAVELPNIRRYLAVEYNGHDTDDAIGITFIGRDPSGSDRPWTTARSAY